MFTIHSKMIPLSDDSLFQQAKGRLAFERGMVLSSGTEYPGKYSRYDLVVSNPPILIEAKEGILSFIALNKRGVLMLLAIKKQIGSKDLLSEHERELQFKPAQKSVSSVIPEEQRSLRPSVFSFLRKLLKNMPKEHFLGFYGLFGYDLLFDFEPSSFAGLFEKGSAFRLFWADNVLVCDRKKETFFSYEFELEHEDVLSSSLSSKPFEPFKPPKKRTFKGGEVISSVDDQTYQDWVLKAKKHMSLGEIYELVLSREFSSSFEGNALALYEHFVEINPSPYQFFVQLGDEIVLGSSPEMFVRVFENIVESCPISGTIKRGSNAMEDAEHIKTLLNSRKDEVELTMCTDVDRNDKARLCEPGSVKLVSRRQIESYRHLFHTVDHIQGVLKKGVGGLDAFLSHMWAVTLMGAPKISAARLIQKFEKTSRNYYGGAVGHLGADGCVNTGITIRALHLKNQKAYYRSGATLVLDSDPETESLETHLKASVFKDLMKKESKVTPVLSSLKRYNKENASLLFVDYEDSFVHILSDYFRQCGAQVQTFRAKDFDRAYEELKGSIHGVIHSSGPGVPEDFGMIERIKMLAFENMPQFGVCLGFQGMIQAMGGKLAYLPKARQGKRWRLEHSEQGLFQGLKQGTPVGAYHALIADERFIPQELLVTARTQEQGHIMAIKHKTYPLWGVQFHPESILSLEEDSGLTIIQNALSLIQKYHV